MLGAVETRDHDLLTIRKEGIVNAHIVCELIEMIDACYPGEEITLVMDNAKYQYCKKDWELACKKAIETLYLPSYSPNLSLIERVWRLVKRKGSPLFTVG